MSNEHPALKTKSSLYEEAVSITSRLIQFHMNSVSGEYHEPHKTPDESDHFIKTHEDAIKELRAIRERYENLYSKRDYLEP